MSSLALYLAFLIGGVLFLVRGLYVTRLTWRPDVAPYGRRSRAFQIALHPENYATTDRLTEIRVWNAIGGLLLCIALLVVIHDVYRAVAGH